MKKTILIAAGVAGMLLGSAATDVNGAVNAKIYRENGRTFVFDKRPNFIMLPEQGFSVAVGSQYDIVFYDNRYYMNHDGSWYRSTNYHGPWKYIRENDLPSKIRRHRLDDIRRFRDNEYSRHNNNRFEQRRNDEGDKRTLEQQRNDENNRRTLEQQRSDENNQRTLDQQRSDENKQRTLDQQRSDENSKRTLDQQRSDENNKRLLEQQRSNEPRR